MEMRETLVHIIYDLYAFLNQHAEKYNHATWYYYHIFCWPSLQIRNSCGWLAAGVLAQIRIPMYIHFLAILYEGGKQ
jgi:hypothetical protein